jgi:Galactoside-binding lectin
VSSARFVFYDPLRHSFRLIEAEAETYGGFPFEFEKIFKIALGFDASGIRVSVDGKFFCEYPLKARLRLASISGLKIRDKNDMSLCVMEIQHIKIDKNLPSLDTLSQQ